MHARMLKTALVIPPLAVLTLSGLAFAQATSSHLVEVEIVDTPKQGAARTSHFAMAVVEDRGWFSSDTNDVASNVHATARIDRDRSSNVVLNVEVKRHGAGDLDVHAAKIVTQRTRSLMGRVERDNGVSELFVTVR